MAVAFDASSSATVSSESSKSWSHTASGSDRAVWVCVCWYGFPSDTSVTAVTYDGTDITSSAFGIVNVDYSGYPLRIAWYELKAPPTGAKTVAVTFSGTSLGIVGAVSATGVNQTTAHGTPVTGTGSNTATDANVTVTGTTSGNLVLGAVHNMPTGSTLTVNQGTQVFLTHQSGGGMWGGVSRDSAGGDKTLSWSIVGNNWWSVSAFEALAVSEITGTASITQGANTISAAGSVSVNGSASITQGANTISAAGEVTTPVSGGSETAPSGLSGLSTGLSGL